MRGLPTGWEWTTIEDLTLPVSKVDPRNQPDFEFDYIDIGGVDGNRGEILETQRLTGSQAPSRARQLVRAGDTVLSTVRTYMRKTALVPSHLDGQVASTGFSVLRPAAGVEPMFLYHAVRRQQFVDTLSSLQTGSSYPAVRDKDVRSMPVPLAPTAEQERIVAAIEEHLSQLDAAESNLAAAEERVALLEQAGVRQLFEARPWPWRLLGEIAEIKGGVTKDSKRQSDPSFVDAPYLRVANVQRGRLDLSEVTTIRVHPDKVRALRLEPGDVLMNEGGDRDKLGRGWVWEGQIADCIHQNHVFRARLNDEFDPYFVSTHANTWGQAWFEEHGRQTTNLASINLGTLKQLPVPAPPRSEQEAIVAELKASAEAQRRLVKSIHHAQIRAGTLRRTILAAAFAGQLVPQDPADEPASALLGRIRAERSAATPTKRTRKAKAS